MGSEIEQHDTAPAAEPVKLERPLLSGRDMERIAERGIVNARTVRRVYEGRGNAYSRARVLAAAQALGLPLPSERNSQPQRAA